MQIIEKFKEKAMDNMNAEAVTIAFLGDSVTQGCFEIFQKGDKFETIFDYEHSYSHCLCRLFSVYYPSVPVNIIKSGISGDNAQRGAQRVKRDVLKYQPDLVVVCYGLNDVSSGKEGIETYVNALGDIFEQIGNGNTEIIFMTPNMLNNVVSPLVEPGLCREYAQKMYNLQSGGIMDLYMEAARKVCKQYGVPVCDCYKKWKQLEKNGVDTTELLANRMNHPTREMSWLFANSLFDTIMGFE